MSEFLDVCQRAARAGGKVLLDMRGKIKPREKAPKDLVTEADFASQEVIRKIVEEAFPDHAFVGEEDSPDGISPDSSDVDGREYCWIVDPLDGTLNYVHQLPYYSVSIALRHKNDVLVGVVFDPVHDACFAAEAGRGAWLNGTPIQTSSCDVFREALIGASLPIDVPRDSVDVAHFFAVVQQSQAIRRLGSAALNMCYVAAGMLDGYWATCAKIWDVAAGQLILKEANGAITGLDGTPFDLDRPQFVASATPQLHHQFLSILRRAGEASE